MTDFLSRLGDLDAFSIALGNVLNSNENALTDTPLVICFYPPETQKSLVVSHQLSKAECHRLTSRMFTDSCDSVEVILAEIFDTQIQRLSLQTNIEDTGVIGWVFAPVTTSSARLQEIAGEIVATIERFHDHYAAQLFKSVFENAEEGVIFTDADGRIIDVNPMFCEVTGYQRHEVIGRNPSILSSGRQSRHFYQQMWQTIESTGHWRGEVWNRKKNGELYAETLNIHKSLPLSDAEPHYVGIFSDITFYKQQQAELDLVSHYDVLTGLPNRNLLIDRINQSIAYCDRHDSLMAVAMLDIDNFHIVNDTFDYETGDRLLIDLAQRMQNQLRENDTLARLGGDEFVIVLGEMQSLDQIMETLQRCIRQLEAPFSYHDQSLSLRASVGATLYPSDHVDSNMLIRHAMQTMHGVKDAGGHQIRLFDTYENQQLIERLTLLERLRQALDNNEFRLFYQPKVHMPTGQVIGFEALIRWQHPERGLLSPASFLPHLQETDVEILIGEWVIKTALNQMVAWMEAGQTIAISINMAAFHLQSADFEQRLEEILADQSNHLEAILSQRLLQLEVLESSAINEINGLNSTLANCQQRGLSIALDDFGTGYSSLTHLRYLDADQIKIDQSFVREMLDNPDDSAIVEGVIAMSTVFGRELIAEGVETTEHGQMLMLMGCENAQGYGIARPMPADTVLDWLNAYQPAPQWTQFLRQIDSDREKAIALLKLHLSHWLKLSADSPARLEQLITCEQNCHIDRWLRSEVQRERFDSQWLQTLFEMHQAIHQAMHAYISDKTVTNRERISKKCQQFIDLLK